MSNPRKYFLYTAYTIVVGIIFLYVLFPVEKVKEYLAASINGRNPDLSLTIDVAKLVFSPGIRLNRIGLKHKQRPVLNVNHITIIPKLRSLLEEEKAFAFSGETNGGRFEGSGIISTDGKTDVVEILTDFSDIQLETIPALQQHSARKITGLLDGKVIYNRKGSTGTTTAELTLADGVLDLLIPFFKVERLSFESIEVDLVLSKKMVQVKTGTLSGEQMDGNFSGTIRLRQPLGNSTINLPGTLKLHRAFLDGLTKTIPESLLPKKIFGEKGLPITLKGTLEKPSFALK